MKFLLSCYVCVFISINTNMFSQNIKTVTIKDITLQKGRSLATLKLENNLGVEVNLSVPEISKEKKLPLIIALHWAGNKEAYKIYSECLAFPSFEFMNAIIVAPSDNGKHWAESSNELKLLQMINEMKKYWPIDSSKIIITGYSNGAIGSWFLSQKYEGVFIAAIPIAGYYNSAVNNTPVYALHGTNDELFKADEVESQLKNSINAGSNIHYQLLDNYSHYVGCSYVEALKAMAKMMQNELFN